MSAHVITLRGGKHEKHIRIPGPGEQGLDAQIIILPVVHRQTAAYQPPQKPRRRKNP